MPETSPQIIPEILHKPLKDLYAVVLAGGVGKRLYPLSTERVPKHLLNISEFFEEDPSCSDHGGGRTRGASLLSATVNRVLPIIDDKKIFVVTGKQRASHVRRLLSTECAGASSLSLILEPMQRNTAMAIGLAAVMLIKKNKDAVMAVFPSDHFIGKRGFKAAIAKAYKMAKKGRLVTFGVPPTYPETGYGYIEYAREGKREGKEGRQVSRFIEKPTLERAERLINGGQVLWNSGIFLWKAEAILLELELYAPKLHKALMRIKDGAPSEEVYKGVKALSIDKAVLARSSKVSVIKASFKWGDLGSWQTLKHALKADKRGNVFRGDVRDSGSAGSIVLATGKPVITIGLEEMVVVDTPEAVFVAPLTRAKEVEAFAGVAKAPDPKDPKALKKDSKKASKKGR